MFLSAVAFARNDVIMTSSGSSGAKNAHFWHQNRHESGENALMKLQIELPNKVLQESLQFLSQDKNMSTIGRKMVF